jgi:DNA (cytosine-5)-methyltransferase 1
MTAARDDDLTFNDLFCGAGGSITGMVDAGFDLVLGANHDPRSIETVSANHRDAEFLCCDINNLDMRRIPRTRGLWASVICTEGSPAGGNRKTKGQLAFEEFGHVRATTWERTRACALDVIRATEIHRYDFVVVENVVEFATQWELYDWWVEGMCRLRPGWNVQTVNVSAAHVYGEGNPPAPQWRDRIYIVFTKKGIPLPDLEPRPPAWCERCDALVEGVQTWKRPDRRQIGKYGQQYLYRCPRDGTVVEPLVLPAIAALDLDDVGTRIGDRKRPLGERTRARIQWGLDTFVQPVVAQVAGNTYERPGSGYYRARPAFDAPLATRNTTGEDAVVTPSFFVKNYGDLSEARYRAHRLDSPLGAITTSDSHGLVSAPVMVNVNHDDIRVYPSATAPLPSRTTKIGDLVAFPPFIAMARRNGTATGVDEPLATVTTSGRHHGLVTSPGTFLVKAFGGNAKPQHLCKPVTDPLGTVTTKDHHYLVVPYRKGGRPRPAGAGPLPTVTTVESAGLLHATTIDIDDCYYRMLAPREHARGQRFDDDYVITGNKGEQTAQVGNAVASNAAQWIGERIRQALEATS